MSDHHSLADLAAMTHMRHRGFMAAREAFTPDNPRATVRLIDASMRYVDALEKERGALRVALDAARDELVSHLRR